MVSYIARQETETFVCLKCLAAPKGRTKKSLPENYVAKNGLRTFCFLWDWLGPETQKRPANETT